MTTTTTTTPAGPFWTMLDWDQSTGCDDTIEGARVRARALFESEPLPCNVSIHDNEGEVIEDLGRSPGTIVGLAVLHLNRTKGTP